MSFEGSEYFYPEEIAELLYQLVRDDEDREEQNKIIDAMYWLKATAENEYNADYFRSMYKLLNELTKHVTSDGQWED